MKIYWRQTGDPWHDWGLCELYDLLESCGIYPGEPDSSGFWFEADITATEFGAIIHRQMSGANRWNLLHPRFQEGKKKIPGCEPRIVDGRRVPGEKCDSKVSKEHWEAYGCKGNLPTAPRNKAQRLSSVPLTPNALADLLSFKGGKASFEEIAALAVTSNEKGDVSQGANPLAAKHHSNGKLRGPSAGNSARTESAQFLLPCYLTSVSPWKPFVKDPTGDCTLYLPENVPFDRSLRLWQHLKHGGGLIHPDEPDGEMYRNLPLRGDGEDAQLLILLDALQSSLAPTASSDDLSEEDVKELNDWLAINYSSGTNVNVGVIHRIEVPGTVFPLLKNIDPPARATEQTPISFARDCLTGVRLENTPIQSHICAALFQKQKAAFWHDLEDCTFLLFKNTNDAGKSNRRSVSLLAHFFAHFAQEIQLMTDEQLTSCRKIGELAGNAFSRDVTLLSRLHNCATAPELRQNLELFAFRLMKASNGDERSSLWHISPEQFQAVLTLASTDEWPAAAQTISLFASLAAFNKNLGQTGAK